jgi:hypothetical protein
MTEPTDPEAAGHGYYVYGITDGTPQGLAPGVGPGAPVELLVSGDLVAIVSPVPLSVFTPEAVRAGQNDNDLVWIEAQVRAHQAVLARAMRQATVVPLRFGTVFRDAAGVRAMVLEHASRFRQALTRLVGRQEWGLKIGVDEASLAVQIIATSARIKDIDARQRGLSSGAAYMLTKQREQILREEVARAIETCVRDAHARLVAEAVATVIDGTAPAAAPSEARPVFRCAYLVDVSNLETFLATLDCLAATHPAFAFTLSGPWPAYSFVNSPVEEHTHA